MLSIASWVTEFFSGVDVKVMLDPPTHLFVPVFDDISSLALEWCCPLPWLACCLLDALLHDSDVTGPGGHLDVA